MDTAAFLVLMVQVISRTITDIILSIPPVKKALVKIFDKFEELKLKELRWRRNRKYRNSI